MKTIQLRKSKYHVGLSLFDDLYHIQVVKLVHGVPLFGATHQRDYCTPDDTRHMLTINIGRFELGVIFALRATRVDRIVRRSQRLKAYAARQI